MFLTVPVIVMTGYEQSIQVKNIGLPYTWKKCNAFVCYEKEYDK